MPHMEEEVLRSLPLPQGKGLATRREETHPICCVTPHSIVFEVSQNLWA